MGLGPAEEGPGPHLPASPHPGGSGADPGLSVTVSMTTPSLRQKKFTCMNPIFTKMMRRRQVDGWMHGWGGSFSIDEWGLEFVRQ